MRLVPLSRAQGATLAADVPAARPQLAPLLRAGTALSAGLVRALDNAGLSHVWVQDDRVAPVELLPAHVRSAATAPLQRAFATVAATGILDQQAHNACDEIVAIVLERLALPAASPVLLDVAPDGAFDARHALGTCALGLLLATHLIAHDESWAAWLGAGRYGGTDGRLARLGVGLLLCDVGRHLRGGLDDHATAGAAILDGCGPYVLGAVRHHRDRFDDPAGPPPAVARIAAVADAVDARVRRAGRLACAPQADALRWAAAQSGGAFDPVVVRALLETVAPHPPGTLVDGAGVVVAVDPHDRTRCTVVADDGSLTQYALALAAAA